MADKGIIFSAPMVRALLDGRKTQTRRLLSIRGHKRFSEFGPSDTPGYDWHFRRADSCWCDFRAADLPLSYDVGDRLYVRETCRAIERTSGLDQFQYRATIDREDEDTENVRNEPETGGWGDLSIYGRGKKGRKNFASCDDDLTFAGPWVPAIHAPRSTSRIWLAVTDVRVQRLQAISLGAICAEGLASSIYDFKPVQRGFEAWEGLWNSLHTAEGERWQDNPWVVAVSFDVHRGNIDAEVSG